MAWGSGSEPCTPRVIVDPASCSTTAWTAFQRAHPETVEIYDVKHKAACLLKGRLEKDPRWQSFASWMGRVRCAIQQTELAALVPPGSRPKARFMNLGPQLDWAEKVLAVVDHGPEAVRERTTPARLEEKLGGVRQYRAELARWRQWQDLVDQAVDQIGAFGLDSESTPELHRRLEPWRLPEQSRSLAEDLLAFVEEQSSRARPGERLPGSTEVLESCFGKYKALEKGQSQGGFTGLLAAFGALLATATSRTVEQAMRAVPTRTVGEWCRKHLGKTVFAQRREIFAAAATGATRIGRSDCLICPGDSSCQGWGEGRRARPSASHGPGPEVMPCPSPPAPLPEGEGRQKDRVGNPFSTLPKPRPWAL